MEEIEKLLLSKYKPSSSRTYLNNIKLIFKKMNYTPSDEPISKSFDLHKFFDEIKDLKPTTQRNYISSLIALLKCKNETTDKFYNALSEQRDYLNGMYINRLENGKSKEETTNWVPADELKSKYESEVEKTLIQFGMTTVKGKKIKCSDLNQNQKNSLKEAVILSFYYYPFKNIKENKTGILRNDIANLKFFKGTTLPDDKLNYFWLKSAFKASIVLRDYKTDFAHGISEIDLDKDLSTILNNYRLCNDLQNGDSMFDITKHGVTNLLIKFSKKQFGKSVGTQMLRKIYITEKFGDTKSEQAEVASNMGHSVATQQAVYVKTKEEEVLEVVMEVPDPKKTRAKRSVKPKVEEKVEKVEEVKVVEKPKRVRKSRAKPKPLQ